MADGFMLFVLRLLGGILLFAFLAALAWLVYLDLRHDAVAMRAGQRSLGHLRVIASTADTAAAGTIFPLLPLTRIGRANSNTIVLEDSFVSAEHALLSRREQQWWLEDLGSRNGTLLNDLPLEEAAVVSAGDVITIGGIALKIEPLPASA